MEGETKTHDATAHGASPEAPPQGNPLGWAPVGGLIRKYAIPSIISMLVSAAYNITDQVFIGQVVGMLGNAATNIAFPITTLCMAISLMLGIGSAANFNLNMGAKKPDEAARFAGTGLTMMVVFGTAIAAIALIVLRPMLLAFGATALTLPYAITYMRITALGLPFLVFTTACSTLIRADGSPTFSMISTSVGAVLNVGLDALFMYVFHWGIAGAAIATVIGQIVSALLVFGYMRRFQSVKLTRSLLRPRKREAIGIIKLGTANFCNHFVMMLVQITLNNAFRIYGAQSVYGQEIPLAAAGVISKLNIIVLAFAVGTAQGCQPIFGFNTGAKKYRRVMETYSKALVVVIAISVVFFACFQIFPRQIISIFGNGSDRYYEFAERYMRVFMMMICVSGMQPLSVNFFTASGKARQGIFLSLTRQGLFLLPLLLILPRFFGIDGVLYAGPIADLSAVIVCAIFVAVEMKHMARLQAELDAESTSLQEAMAI